MSTPGRFPRGWFTIQRTPAGAAELVARIPFYLEETVTRHRTRADAEREAQAIYDQYCADVTAAVKTN
jgi:hypothetical protein